MVTTIEKKRSAHPQAYICHSYAEPWGRPEFDKGISWSCQPFSDSDIYS